MNDRINNFDLVELSFDELTQINGGGFSDGYNAGHADAKPVHDALGGLGILVLLYGLLA